MGKIVNKQELAQIIGKSEVTLTSYQRQGLPMLVNASRGNANQYDTEQVIEWLMQRHVEAIAPAGERIYDLTVERARLSHHQANIAALDEQVKRGALHDSETVARVWGDMVAAFRARMLALPSSAAPRVVALADLHDIEDVITALVHQALGELADYDAEHYRAPGAAGGKGGSAAAAADDKPVGGRGKAPKQRGERGAGKVEH